MHVRVSAVALSFVVIAAARAAPPAGPTPPTMDELRALHDGGKFAETIAAGQRVVALRDAAAATAYPRHEVRMMIADCQIRLKRPGQAIEALKAEAAAAEKAGAPAEADDANAVAMLLRASPTLAYAPTTGDDRRPVDVVAPESRATAMSRLFDDRLAACAALRDASAGAATLAPLAKVAAAYADVRTLAHVTLAATAAGDALGEACSAWATTLIDSVLDRTNEQVTRLSTNATVDDDGKEHRVGRRGELDSTQITSLKQIAADCATLPAVVDGLSTVFAPTDATAASANKAHATKIVARVQSLLDANDRVQNDQRNNNGNNRRRRY